jgi:hypothetical protein
MQVVADEPVPPRRLQSQTPRDLETICLKCLRKDSTKRYGDARALAEDLRRFSAGEPITARPVGQLERAWRWCRRNPGVAALTWSIALLLVLIACGATVAAYLLDQERQAARAAEGRARDAADETRASLRDSYLAQARATLAARQGGQRLDSLDTLVKAAAIRPGDDLGDAAISAMSVADIRVAPPDAGPPSTRTGRRSRSALPIGNSSSGTSPGGGRPASSRASRHSGHSPTPARVTSLPLLVGTAGHSWLTL